MAKSNLRARHKGFTLVEVLVALAIVAVALAAVMRVVAQAIDVTAGLRDRSIALGIAQDRLAQHRLLRDFPDLDTTTGTQQQGGRTWQWQEKVVSTPIENFRRVEIDVRDEREQTMAHLVGFIARQP